VLYEHIYIFYYSINIIFFCYHHNHLLYEGIYTYIPETNYVPREYSVAAILLLQGVPLPTKPGSSLIILLQTHTDIILLQTHSYSFLTQRKYSCSNLVAISSLVLELLKNCRVWYVVGHPILFIVFILLLLLLLLCPF